MQAPLARASGNALRPVGDASVLSIVYTATGVEWAAAEATPDRRKRASAISRMVSRHSADSCF